jgi:membrane protein YdbS with pleckstrin-like domain
MTTANEQYAETPEAPDASKLKASFQQMQQTFKELIDYARYYAELHADRLKYSVLKYALLAILGLAAATLMATLLIAGGIILAIGFSWSLAEWFFEGNVAFGLLLGGALIVVPVLAILGCAIAIVQGRFQAYLGHKYEVKKQEQRARYGHDVEQRAAIA